MTTTLQTEFSVSSATSTSSSVLVPTQTLPVGRLVVVALAAITIGDTAFTVTDSGGNAWTKAEAHGPTNNIDMVLAASILTTQLTTSSTITLASSIGMSRSAAAAAVFLEPVTGPIPPLGTILEGPSQVPVNAGSITTGSATTNIVFGACGFVSSGRVLVPAAGWSAGTKSVPVTGTGLRAVQMVWREAANATAHANVGSITDSGGTPTSGVMFAGLGYVAQSGGTPPVETGWTVGKAMVFDGALWQPTAGAFVSDGAGGWTEREIKVKT